MATACLISAYQPGDFPGPLLVDAYAEGGRRGRHTVEVLDIGSLRLDLDAPLLTADSERPLEAGLKTAMERLLRADHLVLFVPVHRSHVPPLLHAFVRRIFVTDAFGQPQTGVWGVAPLLNLRTARIISTLDPDSWEEFQRTRTARFHPLKKSVLEVMGFNKVRTTTVPPVYENNAENPFVKKWMNKIAALGEACF